MILASIIWLFLAVHGVFAASVMLKNRAIMDVFWGLGIVAVAYIFQAMGQFWWGSALYLLLITVWGLRLSVYLLVTRIMKNKRDPRYLRLEKGYGRFGRVKMLGNYYFQVMLQWCLCVSFMHVFTVHSASAFFYVVVGAVFAIIGSIGEWVSDAQLQRFKQLNHGGICTVGLWSMSRHPNYFFDWVFWVGMSIISWGITGNLVSWMPAVLMYVIFRWMTGPLTEQLQLEKHGGLFVAYKQTVPMIVPRWFRCK